MSLFGDDVQLGDFDLALGPDASWVETAGAVMTEAQATSNFNSDKVAGGIVVQRLFDQIREETGQDPTDFGLEDPFELSAFDLAMRAAGTGRIGANLVTERNKAISDLEVQLWALARNEGATRDRFSPELRDRFSGFDLRSARAAYRAEVAGEAAEVLERASGFSQLTAPLAGGVAAAFTDPLQVSLGLTPIGSSRTVLAAGVKEAAVNLGIEALIQPVIASNYAEAGLAYTQADAAFGLAAAAIFGGAIGTGGKFAEFGLLGRPEVREARKKLQALPEDNPLRLASKGGRKDILAAAEQLDVEIQDAGIRLARDLERISVRYEEDLRAGDVPAADHIRTLDDAARAADQPGVAPLPRANEPVAPAPRDVDDFVAGRRVEIRGLPVDEVEIPGPRNPSPLAVYESADGTRQILTAVARASDTDQDAPVPARIYREELGWSEQSARAEALKQDAADGQADVLRIASLFRDHRDIVDDSLPLGADDIRQGRAIATLSDAAYERASAGEISSELAAEVATYAPDPATHSALFDRLIEARVDSPAGARGVIAAELDARQARDADPVFEARTIQDVELEAATAAIEGQIARELGDEVEEGGADIVADVSAKLVETGAYRPDEARIQAQAFAAMVETLAARTGSSVDALMKVYAPAIEKGGPGDSDAIFAQAFDLGFKGADPEEAAEWIDAGAQGLDLSDEARLARAREMGFDTSTVLYHGSPNRDIEAFNKSGAGLYGQGVYVSPNKGFTVPYKRPPMPRRDLTIEQHLKWAFKGKTYKLFVRGEGIKFSDYRVRLRELASDIPEDYYELQDWLNSETGQRVQMDLQTMLRDEGITHLKANKDVVLVFEPSDVRSVDAAFNPDRASSAEILAQGGIERRTYFTPSEENELSGILRTAFHWASEGRADRIDRYRRKLEAFLPLPGDRKRFATEFGAEVGLRPGEGLIEGFDRIARLNIAKRQVGRLFKEVSDLIERGSSPEKEPDVWNLLHAVEGFKGPKTAEAMLKEAAEMGNEVRLSNLELEDILNDLKARDEGSGTLNQPQRGAFNPRSNAIALFDNADPSTFMHESAHWYLDTLLRMDGQKPNAFVTEQLDAIFAWKKLDRKTEIYDASGRPTDAGRELHEAFAESFEKYLETGKAPSSKLRAVFDAFRDWLTELYLRVDPRQRADLTPEIRTVFNRMMATDSEINARRYLGRRSFRTEASRPSADELFSDPDVIAAEARQHDMAPTMKIDERLDGLLDRGPRYQVEGGPTDLFGAVEALSEIARDYAGGNAKADRKAVIVTGPPAAGKSSVSEAIAGQYGAAIVDPDDAKRIIPEFQGGIGANAVHRESKLLSDAVLKNLINAGENVILPRVGSKLESLDKLRSLLKSAGYEVSFLRVHVDEDEAARRMIARFKETGRLISPDYFRSIGDGPKRVLDTLKKEEIRYAEIDLNGPRGTAELIEGEDAIFEDLIAAGFRSGRDRGGDGYEARPDVRGLGEAEGGAEQGVAREPRPIFGKMDNTVPGQDGQAARDWRAGIEDLDRKIERFEGCVTRPGVVDG